MTPDSASRTELRHFGLLVGGVMLVLGGWWRHRAFLATPSSIALVVGGVLVAGALIAPSQLRLVHRYWMALSEGMAFVMTRVTLLVVFGLVVTPIGLVRRALGASPLRRDRRRSSTYWESYSPRQRNPRHYENMF